MGGRGDDLDAPVYMYGFAVHIALLLFIWNKTMELTEHTDLMPFQYDPEADTMYPEDGAEGNVPHRNVVSQRFGNTDWCLSLWVMPRHSDC